MEVGEQADPVRPRVRGEATVLGEDELGQRARARHAQREHDVRLEDVERVGAVGGEQLVVGARHLAPGDRHAGLLAQRAHACVVGAGQRLLDPGDALLGQCLDDAPCCGHRQARRDVAGHAPPLVEVDTDLHVVADRGADGRHDGHALLGAVARDAHLERAEALLAQRQRVLGPRLWGAQLAERGVGGDAVDRAAEQRRAGHAERLSGEIPERRLERPRPPRVQLDRLQRARVAREAQRVLAEEQVGVGDEPVHRVARADADEALVGLHAHERGVEGRPRNGVPGGAEGRVEGERQALERDRRDAHRARVRHRRGGRQSRRFTRSVSCAACSTCAACACCAPWPTTPR